MSLTSIVQIHECVYNYHYNYSTEYQITMMISNLQSQNEQ